VDRVEDGEGVDEEVGGEVEGWEEACVLLGGGGEGEVKGLLRTPEGVWEEAGWGDGVRERVESEDLEGVSGWRCEGGGGRTFGWGCGCCDIVGWGVGGVEGKGHVEVGLEDRKSLPCGSMLFSSRLNTSSSTYCIRSSRLQWTQNAVESMRRQEQQGGVRTPGKLTECWHSNNKDGLDSRNAMSYFQQHSQKG
jgi:hypothetical protein